MSILEPGTLVACINNQPILGRGNRYLHKLVLGQVYTIRDVVVAGNCSSPALRLEGTILPKWLDTNFEVAYDSLRFRPCNPTNISVFESALHPCKLDVFKEQDQFKEALLELEKIL